MLLNALASLGHKGIKTLRTFRAGRVNVIQCAGRQSRNFANMHRCWCASSIMSASVVLIIVVSGVFIGMVLGLRYLVLRPLMVRKPVGYAGGVIATA